MTTLDPDLLEALLPEWDAAAASLAEAPDEAGRRRAVATLRGLAGGAGIGSLRGALAGLDPWPEDADPAATGAALRDHARAVAASGEDRPFGPAVAPGATPGAAPAARRRAVVVDDSAMMRRLVRDAITADPEFEVVGEAGDGREALALIADTRPDLILLDIEMPVLDGLGVLRDWALTGEGAVVVVSSAAVPGGEVALEARRLGAAAVVGKPSGAFSPERAESGGAAIRRAARRVLGMPARPAGGPSP